MLRPCAKRDMSGSDRVGAERGITPHVGDIASAEQWLFGGHLPTAVIQGWMEHLGIAGAVDYGATVVYFGHFVVPVLIGISLWLVDRTQFLRFTTALLGMAFCA